MKATDDDEGTNSEVVYEIESGTTKDMFKIESNGDIKTRQSLDRELHGTHRFAVAAKDKGSPSLRGTANVVITVLDENDNAPVFDQVEILFKFVWNFHIFSINIFHCSKSLSIVNKTSAED